MNAVDIVVVIVVSLLVLGVIFLKYILPKIFNRKVKSHEKGVECSCANCKHH